MDSCFRRNDRKNLNIEISGFEKKIANHCSEGRDRTFFEIIRKIPGTAQFWRYLK
ncbi:Uncharacterized protein dnm_074910 [Desulfonema magnum]|uniref:Uncharacterized protein n=1 Tax=Desulfonema magnum TaxID=45655 RepID=A0A975GRV1_9BACT|nr:Uncharacterized protein dnm_074910 [Desulfonema magnum]